MAGLFNSINAASTSMQVSQKQIEITGNNIANVDTEGYSKQSAVKTPFPSVNFGGFFIGNGVTISDVTREYNTFVSKQLTDKSVSYGYENSRSSSFSELERIFAITDNNLSSNVDTFFDKWQELSTDPTNIVLRDIVIQQGDSLARSFNNLSTELDQLKENIGAEITSKVEDTNSTLNQLAELNDRIYIIESSGQTANSARDERDLLLQQLAESVGAESYELDNGMVNVQLKNGLPLVNGNTASTIVAVEQGSDMTLELHTSGTVRPLDSSSLKGAFGGLVEMREDFIGGLADDLDKMAYNLINSVNDIHSEGAGLDGSTGNLFFEAHDNPNAPADKPWQGAARNMTVAIDDPSQIAAAAAPEPGESVLVGDNSNALAIANLSYALAIDGTDSFDSFYGKMVSTVGIASKENQMNLQGAEDALNQVQNLRDSYAGVSLDEEMIDLIQFQRNYQSAAQYLSIVDELMGDLINMRR